jgi:hypothetical protein
MQPDNIPQRGVRLHPDLQLLQFLAQLPPPVRQIAQRALKERRPCLLCGGRFHALGLFVPHMPAEWGIPPGMEAACVYTLCTQCGALPDLAHRAEALQRARAPWT